MLHLCLRAARIAGSEPEVLLSIPWHHVDIDVLLIECNRCEYPNENTTDFRRKRQFLRTFLDIQGYDEMEFIQLDYVYKKRR